jgi:hypothetical protein
MASPFGYQCIQGGGIEAELTRSVKTNRNVILTSGLLPKPPKTGISMHNALAFLIGRAKNECVVNEPH